MVGLIAYQMCITFCTHFKSIGIHGRSTADMFPGTAAFPGLARNTPEMREKAKQYEAGKIDRDTYDFADMMQRNRIQLVLTFCGLS
jgi:hypothetical protein